MLLMGIFRCAPQPILGMDQRGMRLQVPQDSQLGELEESREGCYLVASSSEMKIPRRENEIC